MNFKAFAAACLLGAGITTGALAAPCITSQGAFAGYKDALGREAAAAGVGQRGMQALGTAQLSGITWKFESQPSSQTGTSYGDPGQFLAKRSGSSAAAFISRAKSKRDANANTFASIERSFGVPGSILATIWGLETSWGGYLGKTPVVGGAVTLSSYCRRHPKFEPHAIAALQLVDRGLISSSTQGGPSGELGHMQFLAGNWIRYGVDATGDGKADPYSAVDALASAANMLRMNGWKAGQPFGPGTHNFNVLSAWNDSGNYQRAIAYAASQF
ncbi:lytic murein transglycosylase [Mesobacterium pallidum]|uniref:lytic murein transglycosylase n=1 Tax=Mesobacterium pallidum TaxID=2872037 RepID=UPI001EE2B1F1|nr:lytic murein transglycosylase [Mesobacterium pallidum]